MAPMPVPPDPGGEDRVVGLQQGLRLSDAEGIAAERLDGAAEGSLKEALAVAAADEAGNTETQPVDSVAAVVESFASAPLVRLIDAHPADVRHVRAGKPLDAFSRMPMPPVLDIGIALVAPAASAPPPSLAATETNEASGPALVQGEDRPIEDQPAEDRPSADWQGFTGETPPAPVALPPQPVSPLPEAAPPQDLQPLTSALDAAVRLAADASVAADALENLKRMLEHKQRLETRLAHMPAGPVPVPAPAVDDAEVRASTPDAPALPPLPPLPLPLHAEAAARGEAARTLLPPPRRRLPPERRGFDVRGFMAGFALSWAFGVVLYLFMTAG